MGIVAAGTHVRQASSRPECVLPNDAGASCEDTFPAPKLATNLFRASLHLIVDTGTDAAVEIVAFFAKLKFEFALPCSWPATKNSDRKLNELGTHNGGCGRHAFTGSRKQPACPKCSDEVPKHGRNTTRAGLFFCWGHSARLHAARIVLACARDGGRVSLSVHAGIPGSSCGDVINSRTWSEHDVSLAGPGAGRKASATFWHLSPAPRYLW